MDVDRHPELARPMPAARPVVSRSPTLQGLESLLLVFVRGELQDAAALPLASVCEVGAHEPPHRVRHPFGRLAHWGRKPRRLDHVPGRQVFRANDPAPRREPVTRGASDHLTRAQHDQDRLAWLRRGP